MSTLFSSCGEGAGQSRGGRLLSHIILQIYLTLRSDQNTKTWSHLHIHTHTHTHTHRPPAHASLRLWPTSVCVASPCLLGSGSGASWTFMATDTESYITKFPP